MNTHLFISCFWGFDPLRTALAQKFADEYPQVHILQVGHSIRSNNTTHFDFPIEQGHFYDYKMINVYLRDRIYDSVTLIDSDLILPISFFDKIINKHIGIMKPQFLTYKYSLELKDDELTQGPNSMVYNFKQHGVPYGKTGYILSFNRPFMDNYGSFPESFYLGGFDYFITRALYKKILVGFEDEYNRVPKGVLVNIIDVVPIHNYHGPVQDRMTKWDLYNKKSYCVIL
jgi:hypothetical protein